MVPFLILQSMNRSSRQAPPPTCPHCHKVLPKDWTSGWEDLGILAAIVCGLVFIVWATLTFMEWAAPYPDKDITLVQVIVNQWKWLGSLLKRIW